MAVKLIKVDRNGTKYFSDNTCPKCGGSGYIRYYDHISGGVCFRCEGTGIYETHWKEYTPEYAKKLADKRLEKAKKTAPERNLKYFEANGMSADGIAWVVLGNTFAIKDQLKEAGARFTRELGWHFDHPAENCIEVSIEQIGEQSADGTWCIDRYAEETIKELKAKHAPKTASEYIGNVGDKLELMVKLVAYHTYETHITYRGETHYVYHFCDEAGNSIIWNTTAWQDIDEGKHYMLKGTIKEHSEYKGDKQTVLTRCRIKDIVKEG